MRDGDRRVRSVTSTLPPREFKVPSLVAEVRGLPRRAGTICLRIDWGGPTGSPWGFVQRKSYKNRTKAALR